MTTFALLVGCLVVGVGADSGRVPASLARWGDTLVVADGSGAAEDPDGLDHQELLRLVEDSLPIADFDRSRLGPKGVLAKISDPSGVKLRTVGAPYPDLCDYCLW